MLKLFPNLSEKRCVWMLVILSLSLFFPFLGARDLWAPVEPRYAEIVRIMFAKGEWIVPTVNGDLYTDKPILYFWLALIGSIIAGGVNEWTVRLPASIAGIGFVLTTYFIGRDFFSTRVGVIAAAVLATSMRVIWEARWAHIDMVFSFFFVLTIYFGARAVFGKGGSREVLWAYLFMALAVLSKGLIGIVLPGLLLVGFVTVRRDWRKLLEMRLPLGIVIFLSVAAPWFYLVNTATNGRWLADFIYVHHVQRYTGWDGHQHPFYYYLTTLPLDFLPWTVFAVPAAIAYCPYRELMRRPIVLLFLLWFAVVFLFFSASHSKRDLYLLPLLPTLALLVGNYIDDLVLKQLPESELYRWLSQFFFGAVAVSGLALPVVTWIMHREGFWISLPAAVVLAIGGTCTVVFIRKRRPLRAATTVTLLMTLFSMSIWTWVLPYINQFNSRRAFSRRIKEIVPATAPLYIYDARMHDFNFYTEREIIPVLSSLAEVEDAHGQLGSSYMLIKRKDLRQLSTLDPGEILMIDSIGRTSWSLIALNAAREPNRHDAALDRVGTAP